MRTEDISVVTVMLVVVNMGTAKTPTLVIMSLPVSCALMWTHVYHDALD